MTPPSVLRTFLFAPGNHARRVEKALTLGADAVILDLEDAVAIAEKVATRQTVLEALARPRRCKGYIRVNAIVPGATRTERQVALWWTDETMARLRREQCLDRIVEPPDIARMALFLAADDSAAITAQSFRVDAGLA